VNELSFVID